MGQPNEIDGVSWCGREFTTAEIEVVRGVVEMCPGLARLELARTLCENLGWFTASGGYKVDACLKLLEKLATLGVLELPEKFRPGIRRKHAKKSASGEEHAPPPELVCGTLRDVGPVSLELALDPDSRQAWKQAVDRYHYLGYKRPFGCRLAYSVVSPRGWLGCVSLAGAAKSLRVRDRWIGWTAQQRTRNLPWVLNNQRFLVFPWVQVRHLASHVLGQLARRVGQDWWDHFGYRPLLLETFVDPQRFRGTCYRAAGWVELGRTTGEGLTRPGCTYSTSPKAVWVRPLSVDFRELLCSGRLQGRNPNE